MKVDGSRRFPGGTVNPTTLGVTTDIRLGTDPTDPDTDDDGYWDGWIGVYNVNYSDNVVLYEEHLLTDTDSDGTAGIDNPDNIVQQQVGVHNISQRAPAALGADIDRDRDVEHANLHFGELHWKTVDSSQSGNPTDRSVTPDPTLAVEIDYVVNNTWPGDGSPFDVRNTNGVALTTAIEDNYALYGIDLRLIESDKITKQQLGNIIIPGGFGRGPPPTVTPDGLNRKELGLIEDRFHDDTSRLHMLWGTTLRNDTPKTPIDARVDYSDNTGLAWHVGSPDAPLVRTIENDFGIMIARDQFQPSAYQDLQSVGMHELGHALSVGWADDAEIPVFGPLVGQKAFEVYSGNPDPTLTGGVDPTPETVSDRRARAIQEWSIMRAGTARNSSELTQQSFDSPVFYFSIEEVSTADIHEVPSKSN